MQIREEISEIETREWVSKTERIHKTKSYLFEKTNKVNKHLSIKLLAWLIRNKKEYSNCSHEEWERKHHHRFYRYYKKNKEIL
jgi:hypothetical protein